MSAVIIDGAKIAGQVKERVAQGVADLNKTKGVRACLAVIYVEPFFDGFEVVVAAARFLAALYEAVDKFAFGHVEAYHYVNLRATASEHFLQCLGLLGGAWEPVENHPLLFLFGVFVEHFLQYAYHQVVGDKFAVVDVSRCNLAKLGAALDVVAQHIAGGDVEQPVMLYQVFTLSAFARTRGSENYDIVHIYNCVIISGVCELFFFA